MAVRPLRLATRAVGVACTAILVTLAGCGGGGGSSAPAPTPSNTGDPTQTSTQTSSENNTPVTPVSRRIASGSVYGGYESRLLVQADGTVLVLGTNAKTVTPTTPVPGTTAAKIDGLTDIVNVHLPPTNYGPWRAFALDRNGGIWAWGDNAAREFNASYAGINFQHTPVRMQRWGTAKNIVTCYGYSVALILKADGTLRYSPSTVPDDNSGEVAGLGTVTGLTQVTHIAAGMQAGNTGCTFVAVTSSGSAYNIVVTQSSAPNLISRYTAAATPLTGVPALRDAQCSNTHCLARAQDGTTWAWGDNAYGKLGDGTTTGRSLPVEVQGLNPGMLQTLIPVSGYSMAITNAGGLLLWGGVPGGVWNELVNVHTIPGQVNFGYSLPFQYYNDDSHIVEVAPGAMLLADGTVLNWGDNNDAELGDGTTTGTDLNALVQALGINLN